MYFKTLNILIGYQQRHANLIKRFERKNNSKILTKSKYNQKNFRFTEYLPSLETVVNTANKVDAQEENIEIMTNDQYLKFRVIDTLDFVERCR